MIPHKTIRLLLGALMTMLACHTAFGQGAHNIVISEVLTDNTASIVDEYGQREAWIELANTSYTTYNVRGMYLTTDRSVLNRSLSAPERISRMSVIPNGDERTVIGPLQHLVFFANSEQAKGKLHLSLPVPAGQPVWIGLYNGNGVELIDSVSVPALEPNASFARSGKRWVAKSPENVTPGIENFIKTDETKVEKFKREDPHGFAMAIMAMGIVFSCLALLWIFFTLFGIVIRHIETAKKVVHKQPIKPITKTVEKTFEVGHRTGNLLQDGLEKRGVDIELYMAVIGMALSQYENDVHDVESGIITIKPHETGWDDEHSMMTHFHDPVVPTTHQGPRIPTGPELH